MTRDRKTISAVFMAVLLVLASGTAVSLAVTDTDNTADAALQETTEEETTEVVEETVEEGEEEEVEETTEVIDDETTEAADGDEEEAAASVTMSDQESEGERVVIDSVTMDEGGFVVIHDETLEEDAIGSVLGNSVYLEPGTHEDVTVTLARPVEETQTLIAMPHLDTNNNEVYDFVVSDGAVDAPYVGSEGDAVVDDATVSVGEEPAETTEEVEETTTEEVIETTEEDVDEETTEEDDIIETTTEEDEEDVDEETTTEEEIVETTTEEEEEDELEETTTEDEVEEPTDQQQFVFKIEQMNIDRWSFVAGDEETPDRTETVSDITVTDRRVEINLTELLQQQAQMPEQPVTTQDPEEAQEQLQEDLSGDLETVRFVIEDVTIENVTFVVTAPEDMEMPEPPVEPETTTEEEDEVEETTTEEEDVIETTTEEEEVEETTTEEVIIETTTEEEDEVEETTTEEDELEETTTEEEDVIETTTEEEDELEETTTEEDEVEETTTEAEEPELESFDVDSLDAPESAEIGDTVTVSAVVTNPNDVEASQDVAFRLRGEVIERESVTIEGDGEETVSFEVDTTDLSAGEYIHGIYTRNFGDLAVITLDEPTAEETEAPDEDEEETEVPDEDEGEETTEAIETEVPEDEDEAEDTATVAIETTTENETAEA